MTSWGHIARLSALSIAWFGALVWVDHFTMRYRGVGPLIPLLALVGAVGILALALVSVSGKDSFSVRRIAALATGVSVGGMGAIVGLSAVFSPSDPAKAVVGGLFWAVVAISVSFVVLTVGALVLRRRSRASTISGPDRPMAS